MDDFNRPLYGDVFGVLQGAEIAGQEEIDRSLWGEIEPMEGESNVGNACALHFTDYQKKTRRMRMKRKRKKMPRWTKMTELPLEVSKHHPEWLPHLTCTRSPPLSLPDSRHQHSPNSARRRGRTARLPDHPSQGIYTRSSRRESPPVEVSWAAVRLTTCLVLVFLEQRISAKR
jgi:hypothetical protein